MLPGRQASDQTSNFPVCPAMQTLILYPSMQTNARKILCPYSDGTNIKRLPLYWTFIFHIGQQFVDWTGKITNTKWLWCSYILQANWEAFFINGYIVGQQQIRWSVGDNQCVVSVICQFATSRSELSCSDGSNVSYSISRCVIHKAVELHGFATPPPTPHPQPPTHPPPTSLLLHALPLTHPAASIPSLFHQPSQHCF